MALNNTVLTMRSAITADLIARIMHILFERHAPVRYSLSSNPLQMISFLNEKYFE